MSAFPTWFKSVIDQSCFSHIPNVVITLVRFSCIVCVCVLPSQAVGPYEYTYRQGTDIDSYPIYGELHVYGGGGYVAELRGDRAAIYEKIAQLKAGGWIDKHTRAVFLEFAVYNPNVRSLSLSCDCECLRRCCMLHSARSLAQLTQIIN